MWENNQVAVLYILLVTLSTSTAPAAMSFHTSNKQVYNQVHPSVGSAKEARKEPQVSVRLRYGTNDHKQREPELYFVYAWRSGCPKLVSRQCLRRYSELP